uniref:Transmembrane protein 120 homolog n=1 Tax=Panagrolaimus sp. ES5 TaxID=591445 RepID=A0AC34FE19_9BILA
MSEDEITSLLKEAESLHKDYKNAEKQHMNYLKTFKDMNGMQANSAKSVKHIKYVSSQIKTDIKKLEKKKVLTPEQKKLLTETSEKLEDMRDKIADMQNDLPAEGNGIYLNIILGSNLNLNLLDADNRYKYKQEYENFKVTVTYVIVVMLFICYLFPFRAIDALCNFLLVWYYCTLTIRESILRVNRSRIKGWWVIHHYISCVIAGITLTWSDSDCYKDSRSLLIGLTGYVAVLQLLQHRYQIGCLRRLHSLGQRDDMDITVEGFSSWMFKGLTFLIPFLFVGYMIQGYCAYSLYTMYVTRPTCSEEWQVLALAILFALVASGNLITILMVVIRKIKPQSKETISRLASKYRPKND